MISGWGNYPRIQAKATTLNSTSELRSCISNLGDSSVIPRGLGRSYGDSALSDTCVVLDKLDNFIAFDCHTGVVTCQGGTSLADIIRIFSPRGWFLPVTPGTRYITVGGAIASDVHGKNHHAVGSFSEYIISIDVFIPDHGVVTCSRSENIDLFYATCGGMGLTGFILSASLRLKPVKSAYIDETIIKSKCLEETFELLDNNNHFHYSVAWIDCLSKGKDFGRSLLMLGEHSLDGNVDFEEPRSFSIPCFLPGFLLNQHTIKIFNATYFNLMRYKKKEHVVNSYNYFYPLDKVQNWNRVYGHRGFIQYQFVVPFKDGREAIALILDLIVKSQLGSFLSVLKRLGTQNSNLLSFPMEGYTLALDFKMQEGLIPLLYKLDDIVANVNGRLYLAKDARMSETMFKKGYPRWERFVEIRESFGLPRYINSLQSRRLGL